MIKDGVKAIKWFTDNGIKTNCTLVFSAGQAILAAKLVQSMFPRSSGVLTTAVGMVQNSSHKLRISILYKALKQKY